MFNPPEVISLPYSSGQYATTAGKKVGECLVCTRLSADRRRAWVAWDWDLEDRSRTAFHQHWTVAHRG